VDKGHVSQIEAKNSTLQSVGNVESVQRYRYRAPRMSSTGDNAQPVNLQRCYRVFKAKRASEQTETVAQ
jgi:hypothetical protein